MHITALLLKIAEVLASLVALWRSTRERRAGRTDAILEQREATDAAVYEADSARTRRRQLDAGADGLRENDGFRRD
jgi:hypothetical protein